MQPLAQPTGLGLVNVSPLGLVLPIEPPDRPLSDATGDAERVRRARLASWQKVHEPRKAASV